MTGSPDLHPDDAARYRAWLQQAFDLATGYLGTEIEAFLAPLLSMDAMIRTHAGTASVNAGLEQAFARAAGYTGARDPGINAILGLATESFNRRLLNQGGDVEDTLALLQQAGAMVLREGVDFIPTDPRALAARSLHGRDYKPAPLQPRLGWLVQGLRQIGVYPEDLVIHVRTRDPHKMRAMSHMLIEIPRIQKQIALNQQKGEVTFVSQTRYDLSVWEGLTKYQLRHVPGITPVILRDRDRWSDRICMLLQDGLPESFPKVSLTKDLKAPKRRSMAYSVALIVDSVKATFEATGEYPSTIAGIIKYGPLANGARTWHSIDGSMRSIWSKTRPLAIMNGLTRNNCPYEGLLALKDAYGLNEDYTVTQIVESIRTTFDAVGEYPSCKTGLIAYGPLANGKRTWDSVDTAMNSIWKGKRAVMNGLTRDNCPYHGLLDLRTRHPDLAVIAAMPDVVAGPAPG